MNIPNNYRFTFKPVVEAQQALVLEWLKQDYIQEWIHGVGLQNTLRGLTKFIQYYAATPKIDRNSDITQHWIGFDGDRPFVYLLTSNILKNEGEYAKYRETDGLAITLDIFICEPQYLGKGLATQVITEFLMSQFSDISEVFIDPEQSNKKAVHVYQKTGFQIVGDFIASWHPVPHYIMKLNMNELIVKTIHTFEDYEKRKQDIEEGLARAIIHKHQLAEAALTLFSDGTNIVFAYGETKVIKIFPAFHQSQFESERLVLKHLDGKLSIKTPTVEHEGEIFGWPYLIMSKLKGTNLETLWEAMPHNNKVVILAELGALIREVHALPTEGLEAIDCNWPEFLEKQLTNCVKQHLAKGLASALVQELPSYLEPVKNLLPKLKKPVLLTGEYTPMNFLVNQVDGVWHISGLIDFGDAMLGLPLYDLLGPGAFLIQGDKSLLRRFLLAYGYSPDELTDKLSYQLTALMLLHQYSNLNIQVRIPSWKDKVGSLKDLENLVWGF